ncbi:MAG: diguanylate cyclase [Methylocystaceae bacterium]|nr:diguanylate cyclase [Methylocystaceae bacterium]
MSIHRIANIIITSTNPELFKDFSQKLESNNYTVLTCDNKSLDKKAKTAHPDLIVIDVSCDDFDGFACVRDIKTAEETQHIPVVIIAQQKSNDLYQQAIDARADDVFIHSTDIQEFFIHIKSLLRLSTMFMELDNRVKLANDFGVPASNEVLTQDHTPYQILLIAPQDGDLATLETLLDGNCQIETCKDYFEAEELLSDGKYDASICNLLDGQQEAVFSLCSRVRNNPRLFNLPMLVISEGQISDRMEAYRRGVTRIVRRPINHASLKAKIKMLVRRQRLRWNIRNAMLSTHEAKTIDGATNAYNREFFEKHFATQVENGHKWRKHLAVVFFSIPNIPSIESQFGQESCAHLLQQIYQWIAGLSRVEDMVARYGNHEFCIVLPDTPQEEAQKVMHRIAGILSYTDFAVVDVFQPISIWVESGITSLELGDDIDILIDRARQNID